MTPLISGERFRVILALLYNISDAFGKWDTQFGPRRENTCLRGLWTTQAKTGLRIRTV